MQNTEDIEVKVLRQIYDLSGGKIDRIINRKHLSKILGLTKKETEKVLKVLTKKKMIRYILFGSLCITDVGVVEAERITSEVAQKIFISYRRSDSLDVTGRIYDRLVVTFGRDAVFKDVDAIPYGVNFRSYIYDAVGKAQVFLAIIGPHWLTAMDDESQLRLNDPQDFVRVEISVALQRNMNLIPVLVSGAAMPAERDLPDELTMLAYQNAAQIRPDPDFHNDVNRLIQSIQKLAATFAP
jgi:hypothetical protein